jgi:hypothetical protein
VCEDHPATDLAGARDALALSLERLAELSQRLEDIALALRLEDVARITALARRDLGGAIVHTRGALAKLPPAPAGLD